MRLMLPTGPNGAARAYPLDGVMDLSRVTLNETIELKRVTGMDLKAIYRGLGLLDKVVGMPNEAVIVAMSEHLDLMEAYRALVWLARTRAGDLAEDGSVLTVVQAVDFPFDGLTVEPDPGDEQPVGDVERESEDPRVPSTDGGPVTVGGNRTTRGRSSKTSAGK